MFRALMYLHHYWPCAALSDGNIVWKISLMKMWCKNEAWESGTPLELHPKRWWFNGRCVLGYTLGYSILFLQTTVRAREWAGVIFYKGIVEVCVCTSSCVGRGECAMAGARAVWEAFLGCYCCWNFLPVLLWCQMKLLYIFKAVRTYKWPLMRFFSNLIFLRKIRFPISASEGVSGCIFLWWS